MFDAIMLFAVAWLGFWVGSFDARNVVTAGHIEVATYMCRDNGGLAEIKNSSSSAHHSKEATVIYGTAVCKDKTERAWANVEP